MNFRIELLSKELDYSQIKAYVVTPAEQMHRVKLQNRGEGVFVPDKMGMHEIILDVDDIRSLFFYTISISFFQRRNYFYCIISESKIGSSSGFYHVL